METCKSKIEIQCLDDLISKLAEIFSSDDIDVDYVQQVMLSYKSNPKEWKKYAHFDRHRYFPRRIDETLENIRHDLTAVSLVRLTNKSGKNVNRVKQIIADRSSTARNATDRITHSHIR
ncbi:cysteine dioxygenase type 1-like protein [Leptotrombidium deliense]|uniref:Cysteine dioxygenase n=1 Tax=Leptotrombidium deliense TaxID=299467 RepID=A0A443SSU6_9ACAR|nr:cysteine dioxygenase type 1-like protein [Leptotrombidium deliense]